MAIPVMALSFVSNETWRIPPLLSRSDENVRKQKHRIQFTANANRTFISFSQLYWEPRLHHLPIWWLEVPAVHLPRIAVGVSNLRLVLRQMTFSSSLRKNDAFLQFPTKPQKLGSHTQLINWQCHVVLNRLSSMPWPRLFSGDRFGPEALEFTQRMW